MMMLFLVDNMRYQGSFSSHRSSVAACICAKTQRHAHLTHLQANKRINGKILLAVRNSIKCKDSSEDVQMLQKAEI